MTLPLTIFVLSRVERGSRLSLSLQRPIMSSDISTPVTLNPAAARGIRIRPVPDPNSRMPGAALVARPCAQYLEAYPIYASTSPSPACSIS